MSDDIMPVDKSRCIVVCKVAADARFARVEFNPTPPHFKEMSAAIDTRALRDRLTAAKLDLGRADTTPDRVGYISDIRP